MLCLTEINVLYHFMTRELSFVLNYNVGAWRADATSVGMSVLCRANQYNAFKNCEVVINYAGL